MIKKPIQALELLIIEMTASVDKGSNASSTIFCLALQKVKALLEAKDLDFFC
jgi:hypothetical protein